MKKQSGSALLIVIIIATCVSGLALSCWRRASLLHDLVSTREQFYQHFFAADMVLHYGTNWTKAHFAHLCKQTRPARIPYDTAVFKTIASTKDWDAQLYATPHADAVRVTAQLYEESRCICTLRCLVSHESVKKGAQQGESSFMVSHFTFGAAV